MINELPQLKHSFVEVEVSYIREPRSKKKGCRHVNYHNYSASGIEGEETISGDERIELKVRIKALPT